QTIKHARPDLGIAITAPTNESERLLANIWQELLGLQEVGIDDNFFELGGHSLLGTQLISRLRKVFGVELSVQSLYDAPTVVAMAETISNRKKQIDILEWARVGVVEAAGVSAETFTEGK